MNRSVILPLFFPTTIVLVDDDEKYLKAMDVNLGKEKYLRLFKDPKKALSYLKDTHNSNLKVNDCIKGLTDQSIDKKSIEVDFHAIRDEISNINRYKEITLIILDYAMPDLSGGEIANEIHHLPAKIILLTGNADTKVAVDLFNQGVIHSYIRKDDPNFNTLLEEAINKLQHEYFYDISTIIFDSLKHSVEDQHTWFKDPAYKKLFQQICEENNVKEYYLLDEYGSYLLLDVKGKVSFLVVADEETMEAYAIHATDDKAPSSMISNLESRKEIPFFYSDEDFNVRPSEWGKYLHPAQLLKGEQNYYYSYITNIKNYKLDAKKIVSYEQFLKAQEKHN